MTDWTPEQQAAFEEAYPPGTVVQLEGGTLDIAMVRPTTRREVRLRPAFWLLGVLRQRRVALRLHRWAAPEVHAELAQFAEGYRRRLG